jgi:DNA polymerase-3 subunit alpha
MTYWSAHTHSRYSAKDALPTVEKVVAKASALGYPALALTDHGGMGGAAQLYTACRKAGIEPLPGIEAYVSLDRFKRDPKSKRAQSMHLGLMALSDKGYRNMVGLTTQMHRQFHFTPIIDMADLAAASTDGRLEGIAVTSGCWFGLLPKMLREGDPVSTRNILAALEGWFDGNLYLEMQHHNIDDEEHADNEHVTLLHQIGQSMGLPMVITQDSHYCEAHERVDHETMKRLVTWSDDPDDAVFPGDGYHMVDESWMASRYTPAQLADGLAGLEDLRSKAKVVIPELDTFTLKVPDTGGDPDDQLRMEVVRGLIRKEDAGLIPASRKKEYVGRCADEEDIVIPAGFSGYLLLFQQICAMMREKGIRYAVRGSASGSLLLWVLDVTSFDSIKWDLPFDRFLSSDRMKPPDIDLDVEHRRRDEVIEWMEQHYHVAKIGTWLQMGLEEDRDGDQKGSLLIRYKQNARKMGKDPDVKVNPSEWAKLVSLASHKAYMSYSVHAAGLLISPDEETAACVPLQYVASSKTMTTAFGKKDVERMGLVKGDFLGLKTLTALGIMCDLTGIELGEVPLTDQKAYAFLRGGQTTGLFQLEGSASTRGIRQLKPTKIADVIAAMALFRPAALDAGATESYIKRRKGEEAIPDRHPIIMEETKYTYGVLLYQEQALNVMKRLGLTVVEIEAARDAIKASNENIGGARVVLEGLRKKIAVHAAEAGMNEADAHWLDEALNAYAGYGFNKAHATAYGVTAYVTAWFRVHHPVAFWAGMLDAYDDSQNKVWWGPYGKRALIPQVDAYRLAAKADGVKLLGPHVNRSRVSWYAESDMSAVRAGLNSIKGIGQVASNELVTHAPYADLTDLGMRCSPRRVTGIKELMKGHSPSACGGVIAALSHAGALHGLALVPPPPPKPSRKKDA